MRMNASSQGGLVGRQGRLLSLTVVAGVVLLVSGCTGPKVRTVASPGLDQYVIRSVVVMPFMTLTTPQVVRADGHDVQVSVGVASSDMVPGPPPAAQRRPGPPTVVSPAAGMQVARMFAATLRARPGLLIHSPAEAEVALGQLDPRAGALPLEERGRKVAGRLKADAALVGFLRVYKERVGSRFGADPAVVGFEVKLVAADGRVLWIGEYYEAQRPMTQDAPGFLERGIGFFTAEQLALYGVEQLVGAFPFGK